jgi:hypothetical protein
VSGHLDACAECEAAARRLDRHTDPLIRALRRAARPAAAAENTMSVADGLGPTVAESAGVAQRRLRLRACRGRTGAAPDRGGIT